MLHIFGMFSISRNIKIVTKIRLPLEWFEQMLSLVIGRILTNFLHTQQFQSTWILHHRHFNRAILFASKMSFGRKHLFGFIWHTCVISKYLDISINIDMCAIECVWARIAVCKASMGRLTIAAEACQYILCCQLHYFVILSLPLLLSHRNICLILSIEYVGPPHTLRDTPTNPNW